MVAYASGASGGLFAPTLFLGGTLGAIVGVLGKFAFGYDDSVVGAVALLGMGSFFASVRRCPLTSIMIIFEMTRSYALILPLMVGNLIAYRLAVAWRPVGLFDSVLLQDGISLKKMPACQGERDWQNLPVSTIMTFDVITVFADNKLSDAVAKVATSGKHAYPVVDRRLRLTRIITHHELEDGSRRDALQSVGTLIQDRSVVTLAPETSIRDAANILVQKDVLQAPVVSSTDPHKLIGIVTLHDIARQQNQISESVGR